MATVRIVNVQKVYNDDVVALNEVNLTVEDGEFFVLVGPSGCGKSTLLRMIAGLEEISAGEIYIGDTRINEIPPKDRDVAMVFQNYALYPHMTVFENMSFALRHKKVPKAEIRQRVEEAADILELGDYLQRKPRALSGGQRQRVAVGRALVRDPNVFLFDEPLSNLDAKLRLQMRVEISQLHKRLQATMIYVTHDQIEAMTMGTRIAVLKDGRVQQVDTPRNLYNNPVNQFVAGFIGSPAMNFISGSIAGKDGVRLIRDDVVLSLPDNFGQVAAMLPDGRGVLGVRPEHIYAAESNIERPATAPIPVVIDIVEPVGGDTYIYFYVGKSSWCMRTRADVEYEVGQTIKICMDAGKINLFHPDSGERIDLG